MTAHSKEDEMARRIAENEARFRDANEKIEDAALRLQPDMKTLPFVCECGRPDCYQTLRLTIVEYEFARQTGTFFACAPGHQITGRRVRSRRSGNGQVCDHGEARSGGRRRRGAGSQKGGDRTNGVVEPSGPRTPPLSARSRITSRASSRAQLRRRRLAPSSTW